MNSTKNLEKMKLTPEQKAFYEYGGAWETTVVIHIFIRRLLKNKGYQLSPALLHEFRDKKTHYGEILREAWKWRRACRAWNPPEGKDCVNCNYKEVELFNFPCAECFRSAYSVRSEKASDNWEPRKEGE